MATGRSIVTKPPPGEYHQSVRPVSVNHRPRGADARPLNARLRLLIWPAAIALTTILAYVPAMRGGFIWDDESHVTQSPVLWERNGLLHIWVRPSSIPQYYPLTHTSFWLEYRLWGEQRPAGYHVTNILLHAANAVLLGVVLGRLGLPAAWWAALVFALHPVHVESVAWISERKNVLSTLFYLLAAITYLRFTESADRPGRWRLYAGSFVLFACALLSKTVTASLPAALLLAIWWKNGRVRWRDVAPLLPFFIVGAVMGLVTAHIEVHHVGAEGEEFDFSPAQRILIAGRAVWFYAWKLLWPVNLTFLYERWHVDSAELWQWAFPAAAVAMIGALLLARRRIGRGPLVAALFFGGTLVPALGFFDVYPFRYSFVADHFQYLASIGPIALAAAVVHGLGTRLRWPILPLAAVPAALAVLVWRQASVYETDETLWLDVLSKNPKAWLAHSRLAAIEHQRGDFDRAIEHLERSLTMHPRSAWAHCEYGIILNRRQQWAEAEKHLRRAIELNPKHAGAHSALGYNLVRQNRPTEAQEHMTRAVELAPHDSDAWTNLGLLHQRYGRFAEAAQCYRQALAANPRNELARQRLASLPQMR